MKKCNGKSYENVLGYTLICITDEKMTTIIGDSALVSEYPNDSQFYILTKQQLEQIEKKDESDEIAKEITKFIQSVKEIGFKNTIHAMFSKTKRQDLEKNGFFLNFNWLRFW